MYLHYVYKMAVYIEIGHFPHQYYVVDTPFT